RLPAERGTEPAQPGRPAELLALPAAAAARRGAVRRPRPGDAGPHAVPGGAGGGAGRAAAGQRLRLVLSDRLLPARPRQPARVRTLVGGRPAAGAAPDELAGDAGQGAGAAPKGQAGGEGQAAEGRPDGGEGGARRPGREAGRRPPAAPREAGRTVP